MAWVTRLATALRTGHRSCHVLDAKYEPGIRASVLYQHGPDLVRGDLLAPDGPPGRERVTDWPGLQLSVYPQDPDLPTLPQGHDRLRDGAADRPALDRTGSLWSAGRCSRRCRVTLLRYRPGKRATVRLEHTDRGTRALWRRSTTIPPRRRPSRTKPKHWAGNASPSGGLRFAPTIGHLPEISVVVQQSISRATARLAAHGPGLEGGGRRRGGAACRVGARSTSSGPDGQHPRAPGREGTAQIPGTRSADRHRRLPAGGSVGGSGRAPSGRPSARSRSAGRVWSMATASPASSCWPVTGRSISSISTTAASPTRPGMRAPSSHHCASSPCSGPWPARRRLRPRASTRSPRTSSQRIARRWRIISIHGFDGMQPSHSSVRRSDRLRGRRSRLCQ